MTDDRRRQCRVQGGWAASSCHVKPKSRGSGKFTERPPGASTRQQPHIVTDKPLLFKDPVLEPMAGVAPFNFSWVVPGVLAGSGLPEKAAHAQYFVNERISTLVSLTEWKPNLFHVSGLRHVHMGIAEFEPPSLLQAIEFVSLVEDGATKKEAVAVHCHWGRGRTGTMIACYLIKANRWSPEKAFAATRHLRPHSVETRGQEQLVRDYHHHLQQQSPSTPLN